MIRMPTFKHFLILSASTVLLASCGGKKDINKGSEYITTAQLEQTQDLLPGERDIATRICYAYRSKNTSFRTPTYTNRFYDFSINAKNCNDTQANVAISTTIKVSTTSSGTLLFTPTVKTSQAFFQKLQTTASGFLTQLCTKIQNNQPISNTIYDEESDSTVQIKFFRDDLDSYRLNYFTKDTEGKTVISSAETFKVRTQFNISPTQVLGMDEKIIKQTTCTTDAKKFSDFSQTFTGYREQ